MDEDYNPKKPEDINGKTDEVVYAFEDEGDDDIEYSGSEDEDGIEVNAERQFNFVSEISVLVDYNVISQYMIILRDKDYEKNHELLQATSKFFNRIHH